MSGLDVATRRATTTPAGGVLTAPPGPAAPVAGGSKSFLLVHGAWHAAVHWHRVSERLVSMGHRVSAIDLPGSGLDAAYPASYLRNDAEALATEPSPVAGITSPTTPPPCSPS